MSSKRRRKGSRALLNPAPRVLIIEDDVDHLALIVDVFSESTQGFEVATSRSLKDGRALIATFKPHVILTDWQLKDGTGVDLLPATGEVPAIPIVVMTSFGTQEIVVEVMKRGAVDYFVKTEGTFGVLPALVHRALAAWTRQRGKEEDEQKLFRAQRLAEIGTLSANIVHRLNNTFASITGYSKLVLDDISMGTVTQITRRNVEQIASVVASTQQVVQGILSLAPSGREADYFSIHRVVEDSIRVLRSIFPANVRIEENLELVERDCFAVAGDLENVFTTIIVNAKEAMGHRGGTIGVSLRVIETDSAEPELQLLPGEYVEIVIADDGEGISTDKQQLIFTRFFTSKPTGTGLGLATARDTVEALGGKITFESKAGKGTTFRIFIPTSSRTSELRQQTLGFAMKIPLGRGEGILLVEDDPNVLDSTSQFLGRLNYEILPARSIREALDVWDANASVVSLLLTDYDLPDGTGIQLLKEFRKRRYKKPVILFSGISIDLDHGRARELGFDSFFRKPLEFDELARQIEITLRNKSGDDYGQPTSR